MIFIYLFIIGLPSILIFFIAKKIGKKNRIILYGVKTNAVITHIAWQHFSRGSFDKITLEYKDDTGFFYSAYINSRQGRYKVGDSITLFYFPRKPSVSSIDGSKDGNWGLLIFCLLLLLFALFAVYKINEMLPAANYT